MKLLQWVIFCTVACFSNNLSAHDLADGYHTITLPDGSIYEGDIIDGTLHGNGQIKFLNGDSFAGRFENGVFHGIGTYSASDGERYHGFFDIDGPSGEGVIQFTNGNVYEGGWSDWQPHGEGKYTADEDIYEGAFFQGSPAGEFVITYATGASYSGGYKNWMYEGPGEYLDQDGAVYSGTFKEGEFVGQATVVDASGNTYSGGMEYWRYHGEGSLHSANGNFYEGGFKNGDFHGQGRLVTHEGKQLAGEFSYGRFHGTGTLTSADGELVLTGPWINGYYVGPDAHRYVREGFGQVDIETVLYDQSTLLEQTLSTVPTGADSLAEVYSLVFASYAGQDVFRKEADFFAQIIPEHLANNAANIQLINNRATVLDTPLATSTNLRRALKTMGQRMNVEEDILLLYVTSHGSREGKISIQMPDIRLTNLTGEQLNSFLDEANIKWRVIVVSACYSGKLIPELANDASLIMTSARGDRTSFGCGKDSDATYFGKALLQESLPVSESLESAFYASRKLVRTRETNEGITTFSEPQIHFGKDMRAKLGSMTLLNNATTN